MSELGLIGKKIGMTREFYKTGQSVPVTVLKLEKGRVIEIIEESKRGYKAIQIGFGNIKTSKISNIDLSKPIRIKPTLHPLEFIRELVARVDETIICLIFFLSLIGISFKLTLSDFFMPWDKSKLVVSALPEEIIFFVSVLKTTESVKVPPASKPIISDILSSFIKIFSLGNLL